MNPLGDFQNDVGHSLSAARNDQESTIPDKVSSLLPSLAACLDQR